jgi:hypothetical protein
MWKTRDERLRLQLREAQRAHINDIRQERQAYYTKRAAAVSHPLECLSLIVDGMDQSRYKVPALIFKVLAPTLHPLLPLPPSLLPCIPGCTLLRDDG